MKPTATWIVLATLAAAVFAGASAHAEKFASVLSTPIGITLQPTGPGQGFGMETNASGGFLPAHRTAYGDERGRTLYTYAKDEPGKSVCSGDCTTSFPPALARADAKPFGDWSVIKRDDGTRQWALKGKPLYTYVEDKVHGAVGGYLASGGRGARPTTGGKPVPPDWSPAYYDLEAEIQLPRGINIADLADGNGRSLVDANGMTIYAYDGDVNKDKPSCAAPCANPWKPLASPQISFPVGDFTFVVRNDGIKQWAYKGAPLYTFEGDRAASYAHGIGVDKRWRAAVVSHYYTPPGVRMVRTPGRGNVWATPQGLTLYRHDAVAYHTGGGHSFRRGVLLRPAVGRQIGVRNCDERCQKVWRPFLAPANAVPSGYWETIERPEGTKQWAYKGFAMWTYTGDKKPGDMTGNDIYDMAISHDPTKKVDIGTPQVGAPALYWIISEPY